MGREILLRKRKSGWKILLIQFIPRKRKSGSGTLLMILMHGILL
jgi:hypothetical protein